MGLSSPLQGLTSLFGMGRGVTLALNHQIKTMNVHLILINFSNGASRNAPDLPKNEVIGCKSQSFRAPVFLSGNPLRKMQSATTSFKSGGGRGVTTALNHQNKIPVFLLFFVGKNHSIKESRTSPLNFYSST